jgi:hypothetical protein
LENFKINEDRRNLNEKSAAIHEKLDELILLLAENPLENDSLQELQIKFHKATGSATQTFPLDSSANNGRNSVPAEATGADFDQLLFINKLDKNAQKKFSIYQLMNKVIRVVISLLLVLLGFGMIIMPAPPYFEMFTLFYINPNDGVTIMDVISLIVAFTGVYILISTFSKRKGK